VIVPSKTRRCERSVTLAHGKQIRSVLDEQQDHLKVTLHASYVQRSISKIACLVHVDARVNQGFRCRSVFLSDDTMQRVISIRAARIHIGEIGFSKICCVAHFPKNGF
jgi:hypothetical protein